MGSGSEFIREQLVVILDVIRRRWLLLCLPVALAAVLAVVAVHYAPTKYVAKSLILLQAANRGANSMQRSNAIEQISAVEAWLKSDQVLSELAPQLSDDVQAPKGPKELFAFMNKLRASLTLELVSGSVLEVRLESRDPKGVGKHLEIILSRLMEGLTGPEQNILSASQFVLASRGEDVQAADAALMRAIAATGAQAPLQIKAQLKLLWALTQKIALTERFAPSGQVPAATPGLQAQATDATTAADKLRLAISDDPILVRELEKLYANYQTTADKYAALQGQTPGRSNYVGIFDSPDNLLVIGRPTDPLVGESVARKLAIAGVLLSVIGSFGLVFLAELFGGLLRTRREYENVAGLPVVARMAKMPKLQTA